MSDSVRSHRWQPTRLPHPWDSPGKNTGVGCHFLLQCMKVKIESEISLVRFLATPWTAAYQAPPSMEFSRQEHWSGVPLPSPCMYSDAAFSIHPTLSHPHCVHKPILCIFVSIKSKVSQKNKYSILMHIYITLIRKYGI